MSDRQLFIELLAQDKSYRGFNQAERNLARFTRSAEHKFMRLRRSVQSLQSAFLAMAGAYGLGRLAKSFIDTGARMDKLKISLDTLTKGKGEEYFKALNEWAMKMPVNTEKAIETFQRFLAMGLKPTIAQMTVLVDTVSALGGGAEKMNRISLALGQISAKGKVMQQDLRQLMEAGVPVVAILNRHLGLTKEQVTDIGKHGVDSAQALNALFLGMQEEFGGLAQKFMSTWHGQMEMLRALWTEFQRQTMEAGVMSLLQENIEGILKRLEEARKSGDFSNWAKQTANAFFAVGKALSYVVEGILNFINVINMMWKNAVSVGKRAAGEYMQLAAKLDKAWSKLPGFLGGGERRAAIAAANERLGLKWEQQGLNAGVEAVEAAERIRQTRESFVKIREELDRAIETPYKPTKPKMPPSLTQPLAPVDKSKIFIKGKGDAEAKAAQQQAKANLAEMQSIVNRSMDEKLRLEGEVTAKIKKLTLSELEYKKWALGEEVQAMRQKAVTDKKMQDQISEYHQLALKNLKDAHTESNRYIIQLSERTAFAMEQSFSDLFFDVMQNNFKTLEEYIMGVSNSIQRISADMAGQMVKDWAFGPTAGGGGKSGFGGFFGKVQGFLGGLFKSAGTGVAAAGGTGGITAISSRSMPYVAGLPLGSFSGGAMAKGGVFRNGQIIPFSNGGVVSFPSLFGLANNKIGLMGEKGDEAIMPLTRVRGKLGVKSAGAGTQIVNNITVHATDAASFSMPETQSQIMNQMNMALRRAQRNM